MDRALRKRHLQTWSAIAVLLPVGIIFSWLVIPNPVPVKKMEVASPRLLPVIRYSKDMAAYCIHIRTNKENTDWQLEWKNKSALTVPTAVIYKVPVNDSIIVNSAAFKPGDGQLVGRIEARGDYVFPLKAVEVAHDFDFIVYDFIHDKVIEFIHF